MKKVLKTFIDPSMCALITAARFNGKGFDTSPFKLFVKYMPEWLDKALKEQIIKAEMRENTAYAWLGVTDDYGNVTWASPGDFIINAGTKVVTDLVVVPAEFMKLVIGEEDPKLKGKAPGIYAMVESIVRHHHRRASTEQSTEELIDVIRKNFIYFDINVSTTDELEALNTSVDELVQKF